MKIINVDIGGGANNFVQISRGRCWNGILLNSESANLYLLKLNAARWRSSWHVRIQCANSALKKVFKKVGIQKPTILFICPFDVKWNMLVPRAASLPSDRFALQRVIAVPWHSIDLPCPLKSNQHVLLVCGEMCAEIFSSAYTTIVHREIERQGSNPFKYLVFWNSHLLNSTCWNNHPAIALAGMLFFANDICNNASWCFPSLNVHVTNRWIW